MKLFTIVASALLPLPVIVFASPFIAERSMGPKPPARTDACPSLAAREPMAEAEAVGLIEKRNVK
jgi:hypothetical protein